MLINSGNEVLDLALKKHFAGHIVPQSESEELELNAMEKFRVNSGDYDIACYKKGEGAKALLVHGVYSRASKMLPIINALVDAGYCVVSFDLPAHGESSGQYYNVAICADAISEILKVESDIESVVAHSFGCACVSYGIAADLFNVPNYVSISSSDDSDELLERSFIMHKVDVELRKAFRAYLYKHIGEEKMKLFSPVHAIPKYTGRLLLIHDKSDEIMPYKCSENVMNSAELSAESKLLATDELGHFHILKDNVVHDSIVSWIQS